MSAEDPKQAVPEEETKKDVTEAKTKQPVSEETKQAVKERLEFFFSDANIRQDAFMRNILLNESGSHPHQIALDVLLKFNTIKQHTTNPDTVLEVAKGLSDQLKISEDEKAIGRVKPFTMEMMDGNLPLSLFVYKIPLKKDSEGKHAYMYKTDDIRALFEQYGKVAMVKLRFRMPDRKKFRMPKGSAWVEFETKEALEKAAAEVLTVAAGEVVEPSRKIELDGTDGKVQLGIERLDEHEELKKKKRKRANGGKDDKMEEKKVEPFTIDWKPGCVIRLEGLSTTDCDREAIIDAIASALSISVDEVKERKIYADYSRGQEDGAIRFSDAAEDIKTTCEKLASGEVKVKDTAVSLAKILEGVEEKAYWDNFIEFKNKQKQEKASPKKNKRFRKS